MLAATLGPHVTIVTVLFGNTVIAESVSRHRPLLDVCMYILCQRPCTNIGVRYTLKMPRAVKFPCK